MSELTTTPNLIITADSSTVELEQTAPVGLVPGVEAPASPRLATQELLMPTDAMRTAAPADLTLRQPYLLGALAAVKRRAHPIAAPEPWPVHPPYHRSHNVHDQVEVPQLPNIASPIVEMVREEMPDLVMVADRGGRLLGLSVYQTWRQRYPRAPFPTIDGTINFGRISSNQPQELTRQAVTGILHRSGLMAEMAQRRAEGDQRPLTVMLLDDWIGAGFTASGVRDILASRGLIRGHNLRFIFGTMAGNNLAEQTGDDIVDRHVVGNSWRRAGAVWTDDIDMIGLDYEEQGIGSRARLVSVREPSEVARGVRQLLAATVKSDVEPSPHPYPVAPVRFVKSADSQSQGRSPWPRLMRRAFHGLVE